MLNKVEENKANVFRQAAILYCLKTEDKDQWVAHSFKVQGEVFFWRWLFQASAYRAWMCKAYYVDGFYVPSKNEAREKSG